MRCATFCWLIVFTSVQAQPLPQLTVLQPPGGKAGTTVHLALTGVDLEEVESLMITPGGITAERTPDPAKPGAFLPNQFTLQIPKEVAPGTFDVRAVNAYGVTNPRAFVVGELEEQAEKEPNNDVHQAQAIPLQSTISGHIANPTDVDYFSIECQQGQTIILECSAESMDSRLYPDIRVFTKSGKLIAANRPRSAPDGYCHFTAPATTTYLVRLCSHAHLLGGAEAFYRLSISTRPWIEAITPAIVEPGKTREAFLWGRNLPGASLDPNFRVEGQPLQKMNIVLTSPPAEAAAQQLEGFAWLPPHRAGLDGFAYRVQNMHGWSNQIPITFSSDNLILGTGSHNSPEQAQPLTLPCDILGRIERVNDRDWYSFTAQAGQTISI
ncbi:MAG TPA: PPC domain-containing protein, partial [Gemmatales bacterium]|nr:PPC domain-containing protein [Gemmatales bacterium]